jgi:Skp family chaperone for outer membrane proteins
MKKTLLAVIPVLLIASGLGLGLLPHTEAQAGSNATKVRAIDLDKVIQKSSKAKAIMGDFQAFQQRKQKEAHEAQAALEKEQRTLSENSSKEQLNAYGQKVQATARKLQTAEMEIQQRFQTTRSKLLDALKPTMRSFSNDNSIGLLLDTNTGGVVYVDPAWDQTKDLLPRID